jgi:predicted nucleotidyltransferase
VDPTVRLAQELAGRLGKEVPGVAAVALGGSWAPGDAHPDSDLELGIYYQPGRPPPVEDCTDLRKSSTTSHLPNLATKSGEWGPWINGGGCG